MKEALGSRLERWEPLFKELFEKYGLVAQENQCIEEMSELTQALLKGRRYASNDPLYLENTRIEIADCLIMLYQMRLFFGEDKVDQCIERQCERMVKRLKGQI